MIFKWLEFPPGSFVEPAEHLIVFQTQYLNSHNQAFQTAHHDISDHKPDDIGASVRSSGEHKDHFHDRRVAYREGSDTHIGKRIGEIAQHGLEQLEESLYQEHHLAFFDLLMVSLHQVCQRFLE